MKKKKIGRNDPCPCCSGIKYKKCCLGRPQISTLSNNILSSKFSTADKNVDIIPRLRKEVLESTIHKKHSKRKKHHYVPIWYQKGFIEKGENILFYLDLDPIKVLPDGRQINPKSLYKWGPGNCFCEKDLYTIKFFGIRNDQIEEILFGKIDNNGRGAIYALKSQDFETLSKSFEEVFIYMDAQKLRTPKGLDWIRSNYFQLSHSELLMEMQFLRTMHCTMWVEGVMEIVSAEDSDIKFIISDHPITIYNYACAPDSKRCKYPDDPPTAWKASQTIFPLDLNHCFILTNLEYARDPDKVDPLTSRTNPRHFADTLTRWDTVIRKRRLNSKEVCAINCIIKKRAHKYIAAAKQEWLYPEKSFPDNEWKSLHKILLPSRDEIWRFGGEVYVGGKDGKLLWYQDDFGRRHTRREDNDNPVRNYSIKQRNQILYNAILEIFGFSKGKDWDDFRKEITGDKIKELYRVVGALWNPDTEIMNLIPKPCNELRAFYSGTIDPRVIPITVLGYSLYVDKIIMISPFINPRVTNSEFSPYENPSRFIDDTIKNVAIMMQIMPLIDAGIVEMIPDPCDFDPFLRQRIYKMAETRLKGRGSKKEDMGLAEKFVHDDIIKFMFNLPPESLKHQIRKVSPDISEDELEEVLDYVQKAKLADPLAPLQPLIPGEKGQQYQMLRMGGNLEMALYLAQVTGSYIYTDVNFRWQEIQSSILKRPGENNQDLWGPIIKTLNKISLTIFLGYDNKFYCSIKEEALLKEIINIYRRIFVSVRNIKDPCTIAAEAKELAMIIENIDIKSIEDMIEKNYKKILSGSSESFIGRQIKVPGSYIIPPNGLSMNTITQILLTHGSNTPYLDSVPLGVFLDLQNINA
jgi:hypothetical protein